MADQITKHFIDYLYCIEELPFGVEDFFNQYRDKLFLTIKNDDVLPGLKAARKEILEDLDSDIKETSIAISCQQAVEIAASDARANQIGYGVSKICLFEEITEREPVLYDVKMEGNWIAYIDTNLHYIGSSTIVVVDSKTGDVLHRGSAGNEG